MKQPHKHAEIIKAWAYGAEIQVYDSMNNIWADVTGSTSWMSDKYRIKPEPKPDKVEFAFVTNCDSTSTFYWRFSGCDNRNLKLTFDGETGELKSAEVLK